MKTILLIIISLSFPTMYSQNTDEKINQLFLNLNLNQTPENIVKNSSISFELSANKTVWNELFVYKAEITSNPQIKSKLKKGRIEIKFDNNDLKNGYYEIIQILDFLNEIDLLDEYHQLVNDFEIYSSKTIIETTQKENYEVDFQYTEYRKEKNNPIPSLSFSFSKNSKEKKYFMIISFKNIVK